MPPRANWKGYLKLSLVSCPVALYPATSAGAHTHFNIINRKTGHRVHNQVVDAESGDPVPEEDRVKGYRDKGGRYVLVEEDEFERVALESTHTIDIEAFVPRTDVDEIYFDTPYYIVPNDKSGQEAFVVIREAMEREGLVGLARVVLYRREHLLMLQPRGKGLLAMTLRFASEVRDADDYFDDIPATRVTKDMLALAVHILDQKKERFDPGAYKDRYETALSALIKAKRSGKELPEAPEAPTGNVVSLMDALRQSVKGARGGKRAAPQRRTKARAPARRGGRRLKKAG
jgi:DNA end-binding protein Ku